MITVLLVDDHAYIRKGIPDLLEPIPDVEVVATASNGIEAVAKARLHQPDVAIIDVSMPLMNGMEATRQIREVCPQTRILALSVHNNPAYVRDALLAGAAGYVLKDAIGNELIEAIRALYHGEEYFSPQVASRMGSHIEDDNESQA